MPTAASILGWAIDVANQWRPVAEFWHLAAATTLVALLVGWRPDHRSLASILALPLASVSVIAWVSGNRFNALMFALIALLLTVFIRRLARGVRLHAARWPSLTAGAGLIGLGLLYPHFVRVEWWVGYLYAAPFGLIPCPTLMVAIGGTLLIDDFASPGWRMTLAAAGVLYGAMGVFMLDVGLDWPLLAAGVLMGVREAAPILARPRAGTVRSHRKAWS